MSRSRLALARVLAVLTVAFGVVYIGWRWTGTINWGAWWIAVPLVVAETYSLSESVLYALTMWNARRRPAPPETPVGRTVDVFITTYNEPLELVMRTAIAARDLTYPHQTYILDDGNRPEFARAAASVGVGYLNRGPEWDGRQRFAKAGNVNNALFKTTGEFIAILDADQVPEPRFLESVLGYFEDPEVAFVQTPQRFWNVTARDPLGSQAELFYGPIQQGKDGWGAAFFCGSNAVLRRDAVMALGLAQFSAEATGRARDALRKGRRRLENLFPALPATDTASTSTVLHALAAIDYATGQLRQGEVLTEITYRLRRSLNAAIEETTSEGTDVASLLVRSTLRQVSDVVDVARSDEALAIHPLDTTSITEDMATAMHLHAMGWSSVYHHEVLVHGLAPEDLGTMLSQRKRWASGSMQVFFQENPLFVRGLTIAQRLMYLATMTSYLNGFAALAFIAAPIVYLTTGIFPLVAESDAFFARFIPIFLCCQALFLVTGFNAKGLWRGQQMSFALFPTWIEASLAGASAALFGRHLTFSVTAKTKQAESGTYRLVLPQLVAMAALLVASGVGVFRVLHHDASAILTALSMAWVVVDLALLGVVVGAWRYRGPGSEVTSPVVVESYIDEPGSEAADLGALDRPDRPLAVVTESERELLEVVQRNAGADEMRVTSFRLAEDRFDAAEALRLRVQVAAGLSEGRDLVLLDVSAVSVITSSGVAALFDLLRFVRSRGGDVRLYGVSPAFRAAHTALRLDSVLRVYDEPEVARTTASA